MIGDPDLAKVDLDPGEFLLFLHRRLRDLFVTDRASLHCRLGALDWEPDPDARYRINEPYCSDKIGNTRWASYTAFEIRLLTERRALKRTVILIDAETDLPAIEQTIADNSRRREKTKLLTASACLRLLAPAARS